jgi:hypothetical protein
VEFWILSPLPVFTVTSYVQDLYINCGNSTKNDDVGDDDDEYEYERGTLRDISGRGSGERKRYSGMNRTKTCYIYTYEGSVMTPTKYYLNKVGIKRKNMKIQCRE